MIMRITWGKLRAGSWKDFEKTYNATVATKGRQIKGLRGRWLLQDTEDKDTGFSVSLWESAGEMQAYEQGELYKKEIANAERAAKTIQDKLDRWTRRASSSGRSNIET